MLFSCTHGEAEVPKYSVGHWEVLQVWGSPRLMMGRLDGCAGSMREMWGLSKPLALFPPKAGCLPSRGNSHPKIGSHSWTPQCVHWLHVGTTQSQVLSKVQWGKGGPKGLRDTRKRGHGVVPPPNDNKSRRFGEAGSRTTL